MKEEVRKIADTIRIELPITVRDKTNPGLTKITNKFKSLDSAVKKTQISIKRTDAQVSAFDRTVIKAQKDLMDWVKQEYQIILEAKDKFSPIVEKLKILGKTVDGMTWQVIIKAVDQVTVPVQNMINSLKSRIDMEMAIKNGGKGMAGKNNAENFLQGNTGLLQGANARGSASIFQTPSINGAGDNKRFEKATEIKEQYDYVSFGDMLGQKLKLTSAAKILPGGEKPDMSSWKDAGNLVKGGLSFAEKGLGLADNKVVQSMVGHASTNEGVLETKGIVGGLAKLGVKLGGVSRVTSGAGLAGVGAGAVIGGVAAGATLISSGQDLYKAFNSEDQEEKKAYAIAGTKKVAATGAGAIIGSMILPGAGTLIGAGIGSLVGMFTGERDKKKYEEESKQSQIEKEKGKYDSKEMKSAVEAVANGTMDAAEAAQKFEAAVGGNLKSHFGDIKLSMEEIQKLANGIVFDGKGEALNTFAGAGMQAENSGQNLKNAESAMDRMNWKVGLGIELSEVDMSAYKSGVEEFIQSSSQFLEDKHYQAKTAIDLLVEPGAADTLHFGLDAMYGSMQEELNATGIELTTSVKLALEDGSISEDEQAVITGLQDRISSITNQLSDAETEATFQMMKVKYEGAALDAESFAGLQSELQVQVAELTQGYDQAYEVGVTNLKLALSNGAISKEEFDEQLSVLTTGYEARINEVQVRVERFQLDAISQAYGDELQGILPEIEGTTSKKLAQAFQNLKTSGIDILSAGSADIAKAMGIDGLGDETETAIVERIRQMAATLPDVMKSALKETGNADIMTSILTGSPEEEMDFTAAAEGMQKGIAGVVESMDLSEVAQSLSVKLGEAMGGLELSESQDGLGVGLLATLRNGVESMDLTEIGALMNEKLNASLSGEGLLEKETGLQEGLLATLTNGLESMDLTEVGVLLNEKLNESLSGGDLSKESTGLQEGLGTSLLNSLNELDFEPIAEELNSKISTAMSTLGEAGTQGDQSVGMGAAIAASVASAISTINMEEITSAINTLKSNVGTAVNNAFALGFSTSTTVTIKVDYKLANPSATINFSGGGSGTASVQAEIAEKKAEGDIVNGPLLSWVGEDGPEAIIPLGSKRRGRGLDLWKRAGKALGIPQFANGKIAGRSGYAAGSLGDTLSDLPKEYQEFTEDSGETSMPVQDIPVSTEQKDSHSDIKVEVQVAPSFEIHGDGNSEKDILGIIKTHMKEMADDLGGQIANNLEMVFSNMPLKEA